jgi:hypothetical protein
MQALAMELANTSNVLQSTFVALHEAETTSAEATETARLAQEQMSLMHAVMLGWHAMDATAESDDCYVP